MSAILQDKIAVAEKIRRNLEETILLKEAEIVHFQKESGSEDLKWAQLQRHQDLILLHAQLRQALDDKKNAEFELNGQLKQAGGLDAELSKLRVEMSEIENRLNPKKEPPPETLKPLLIEKASPPPEVSRFPSGILAGLALAVLAGAAIHLSEPSPFDYGYAPAAKKPRKLPEPVMTAIASAAPKIKFTRPPKADIEKIGSETAAADSKLQIDLNTVPPPAPQEPDFDWMDRYLQPGDKR